MATTYFHGLEQIPNKSSAYTLLRKISYAANPEKTRNGELVTFLNCSKENAAMEMAKLQEKYTFATGRHVSQVRKGAKAYLMFEIRQSFAPGEVTPEQAHHIGLELAQQILGDR